MKIFYSICLVPNIKDTAFLDSIIISLAKKYGSFPFIPHLTIYVGDFATEKEVKKAVDFSLLNMKPFSIQVNKLDHSDNFSKTIFIEFKMNGSLSKIHSALRSRLKNYRDYILHPHISLIYKNGLSFKQKQEIIKSLKIKKEFIINRCVIISAAKPLAKEKDVKELKIIYDKNLR